MHSQCMFLLASFISRPSHGFHCTRQKSGRPGRNSGGNDMADMSSLPHQSTRPWGFFLNVLENMGRHRYTIMFLLVPTSNRVGPLVWVWTNSVNLIMRNIKRGGVQSINWIKSRQALRFVMLTQWGRCYCESYVDTCSYCVCVSMLKTE